MFLYSFLNAGTVVYQDSFSEFSQLRVDFVFLGVILDQAWACHCLPSSLFHVAFPLPPVVFVNASGQSMKNNFLAFRVFCLLGGKSEICAFSFLWLCWRHGFCGCIYPSCCSLLFLRDSGFCGHRLSYP